MTTLASTLFADFNEAHQIFGEWRIDHITNLYQTSLNGPATARTARSSRHRDGLYDKQW